MSTISKTLGSVMGGFKIAPYAAGGLSATLKTFPATTQTAPAADILAAPLQGLSSKTTGLSGQTTAPIHAFKTPGSLATLGGGKGFGFGTPTNLSQALEAELNESPFNKSAGHGSPPDAQSLQQAAADAAQPGAASSGISATKHKTSMDIIAKL